MRENAIIVLAMALWLTCWFGGWLAGGVLFPAYETPAAIGAFLGFFGGAAASGLCLWTGGIGR